MCASTQLPRTTKAPGVLLWPLPDPALADLNQAEPPEAVRRVAQHAPGAVLADAAIAQWAEQSLRQPVTVQHTAQRWLQAAREGIAEGELEQVFEAFHSTKPLGLGVGLAICRRLIEAQGGTLRAAQNPAGGALFEFTLPVAPAESA